MILPKDLILCDSCYDFEDLSFYMKSSVGKPYAYCKKHVPFYSKENLLSKEAYFRLKKLEVFA